MQKLVWKNSIGDEINLTGGNYGITEWEGFANTSLNIQSQQVPFQDGGVFLDALMEQRELSVTLAMNDGGNLETRYRLRRELIHALNPKLGEGYLIYKNNFISKRIKCIAQIPLFETHNSNDSGTPKASLSWTACEPYWEDLEETVVSLIAGSRKNIINNGDVPCDVIVNFFSSNVTNPFIRNLTEDKVIKLNGTFQNGATINTQKGNKTITTNELNIKLALSGLSYSRITYSESLGLFAVISEDGTIVTSPDGINWTARYNNVYGDNNSFIKYFEEVSLFIAGGYDFIVTSSDGINWTEGTHSGPSVYRLVDVTYSESLGLFVAVGSYEIATSTNGIDWTGIVNNKRYLGITYSESLGLFVAVGEEGIVDTSPDGTSWTQRTSGISTNINKVTYSEHLGLFVAVGVKSIISSDGINWSEINLTNMAGIIYSKTLNLFVAVGENHVSNSVDGITWVDNNVNVSEYTPQLKDVVYSENLGLFIAVGNVVTQSSNLSDWKITNKEITNNFYGIIYSESLGLFVAVGYKVIATSPDGTSWTIRFSENGKTFRSVIYSESLGLFIAVGEGGIIFSSPNGIYWTSRFAQGDINFYSITYSETLNLFVVVGTNGIIFTSSNGMNWIQRTTGVNTTLYDITYSETLNLFVAVGVSGTIITSPNGINWTQRISEVNTTLLGITYSEPLGLFVIVRDSTGILTSRDGIDWNYKSGPMGNKITYFDLLGIFIVAGGNNNGEFAISSDAEVWVVKNSGISSELTNVTTSNKLKLFVITSYDGSILMSENILSENLISSLSSNSDMSLNLKVGENEILLNRSSGNLNGNISYRQKYIGV